MNRYTKLLMASALMCAPIFVATAAAAATLTDSYDGGYAPPTSTGSDNQNGTSGTDVVGSNTFQISSLSAFRTSNGSNPWGTLNIVISTYYAGMPEVGANGPALGTTYGDLFITPSKTWNPNTSGGCNDCNDVYKPGEWAYAATIAADPTMPVNHVSGSFYSLTGNSQVSGSALGATTGTINANGTGTGAYASLGTSSFGSGPGVVTSNYGTSASNYTSCDGENTTTNCNVYRADQAVGYDPTTGQQNAVVNGVAITENYSIVAASGCSNVGTVNESCSVPGTITFQIIDNGALGNNFDLSWAMTCANDVIQGQVSLGAGDDPVDEPPTLAIVLAGLLSIVGYRRWAKHKDPSLMQYA